MTKTLLAALLGAVAGLGAVAAPAVASPPPPQELGAPDLGGYALVDMLAACRETTFGYATIDRFADFLNPHSWQCRV